jgi:hypothetical protein
VFVIPAPGDNSPGLPALLTRLANEPTAAAVLNLKGILWFEPGVSPQVVRIQNQSCTLAPILIEVRVGRSGDEVLTIGRVVQLEGSGSVTRVKPFDLREDEPTCVEREIAKTLRCLLRRREVTEAVDATICFVDLTYRKSREFF